MKPFLLVALAALVATAAEPQPPVPNREPLAKTPYILLPLGSVKPAGWLERQLRIQADGLSGHIDEFWPDLGPNSAWLGGAGEAWERGPYFMDGLIPLAYLLNDQTLLAKAKRWVNWALENQGPDGAIGPNPDPKTKDWWPNFVLGKVLMQYHEASGDPRVIPALEKYFDHMAAHIKANPLRQWAIYRWQDQVMSILWLYNRTGNPKLLDLARTLRAQGHDWPSQFTDFLYTRKLRRFETNLATHVVNNAQGLKTAAIWHQVSRNKADLDSLYNQFRVLDKFHLHPNGMHSGDEHYAGRSPVQGAEHCSVVEGMFSLENIIAITGDPSFGDRLEKMAFNALPGTFSKDMWAHQYDQQPNQVLVTRSKRDWTTNGPDSNVFGLEPNFGCCTANMHQGWPKFAANLWMATAKNGLAAIAYAPSRVTTEVNGGSVTITEETEYPFDSLVRFRIQTAAARQFPLELRIPAWTEGATIRINGQDSAKPKPGAFHAIDRTWNDGDQIELNLPMRITVARDFNDGVVVNRGPLVYSLLIGEDWRKLNDHPRAPDWAVHPTTPWNYALSVDMKNPERSFEIERRPLGDYPFSPDGAPLRLKARARRLPAWTMLNDSAAPPPPSPVTSAEPLEFITLVPYGAAKLRITVFPQLNSQ